MSLLFFFNAQPSQPVIPPLVSTQLIKLRQLATIVRLRQLPVVVKLRLPLTTHSLRQNVPTVKLVAKKTLTNSLRNVLHNITLRLK